MINIPCVIFAGGKSSRMGEDKALLPFGDSPTLTLYQLRRLKRLFKNVYISCKSSKKIHFLNDKDEMNFIEDINGKEVYAPTAGFISVFEELKCEKFFAISVDTPFIDKNVIDSIILKDTDDSDATIASFESKPQPMCGIYHISLQDRFIKMSKENNHKLSLMLREANTTFVEFKSQKEFFNINNPQEYAKALEILT